MTIDFENPFLSVSPNLETSCGCCGCSITEIKCPSTICESKPTFENLNYLHEVNVSIIQYYTYIQGQIATTYRFTAWFFVYIQRGNYLEKNLILLIGTL